MSHNITLVGPLVFVLQIVKPSGVAIADANVSIEWEELQNPYDETPKLSTFTTDANGQVQIPILDPREWWIDPEGGTLAKVEISKDFHGPIVPYGTDFKYQPAKIGLRIRSKGDNQVSLRNLPEAEHTYWGRPRVLKQKGQPSIVEVTLMEGGELGKEHPNVRTRRLSAAHRQTQPPSKIPQIDEELLFHIAHGGLAPDAATDYKFKVIPSHGRQGPGTIEVDLPPAPSGAIPSVPRITARNSIVGGLRLMHIVAFTGDDKIVISGEAGMRQLNPRMMVGVVRFARRLLATNADLKVVLTSGFGRAKDDAHGNGRAIDFAGLMTVDVPGLVDPKFQEVSDARDPHCIKKAGPHWKTITLRGGQKVTAHEKVCVAEQDFIVLYHWGMVKLLVDTPTGRVRRAENGATYKNSFVSANTATEELVFRLADLPAAADRHPHHVLTNKHYKIARTLFGAVYAFFAQEFAHRETYLGPTSTIPGSTIPGTTTTSRSQAQQDDAGVAPTVPGPVQGFVLHPDYPAPDTGAPKRQSHANHVHANLGGVRPGSTDFER